MIAQTPASLISDRAKASKAPLPTQLLIPATIVFAVALTLSIWHHLLSNQPCSTFFGDSRHYLESCALLSHLWRQIITGTNVPSGALQALGQNLMMDGPAMPIVPALFFAIVGKDPTSLDRQPFIVLGCILQALSALLIFALTHKLTGSKNWSTVAGLSWATYPPAILSAGRYLTEGPTAFLLLALVWSASRACGAEDRRTQGNVIKNADVNGLVAGAWDGILLLLKPAMIPAIFAVNALMLVFQPRWTMRARACAALAVGICLTVIPWVIATKAMTGEAHIMPLRTPVYNIAKGCDTDADGWGALPESKLTDLLCGSASAGTALLGAVQYGQGNLVNLTLRKLVRLWGVPWNDFRAEVFSIPAGIQALWHDALLILAMLGALAVVSGARSIDDRNERTRGRLVGFARNEVADFVGWASLLVIIGHAAYLPFETISRYGFSAMPFMLILATYGLFAATRLVPLRYLTASIFATALALLIVGNGSLVGLFVASTGEFRSALQLRLDCQLFLICVGLALSLWYTKRTALLNEASTSKQAPPALASLSITLAAVLAATMVIAFYLDGQDSREWSCTLRKGDSARREITLPPLELAAASTASLLIDGDSSLQQASVTINGHHIVVQPESLYRLQPTEYSGLNIMRIFAGKLNQDVAQMRQWRAVSFPQAWLRIGGTNVVTVSPLNSTPVTIYGDYDDSRLTRRHLPAFEYFSAGKFCSAKAGFEGRLSDPVGYPRVQSVSMREHHGVRLDDLSLQNGKQTGQYRLLLMLAQLTQNSATQDATGSQIEGQSRTPFITTLSATDFDPMLSNKAIPDCDIVVNRTCLKSASSLVHRIELPPSALADPYARVTISGYIRAAQGRCIASIVPILEGSGQPSSSMILPATPPFLKADEHWARFEISDLIPPSHLPQLPKYLTLAFYPGPWEETAEYGCIQRSGDACFKQVKAEVVPVDLPQIGERRIGVY